jgi:hypothetical protein
MIQTALSFAKSFLAPFFIFGFLLALLPGQAAAQQGCNPPPVFSTPILFPAGCPSYLNYARLDYLGENSGGNIGTLAVADLNGDGKMDLLVNFSTSSDELAVLLGNGDGTFQPPRFISGICCIPDLRGLNWGAVGDFNGDGHLDIVVGTSGGYVAVFLGDGTGNFSLGQNFGSTAYGGPIAGLVGDFNRDGKLDLLVADNHPSPGAAYLYWGNGNGTFQTTPTVVSLASGDSPSSLVAGDLNNDGNLDFAVTNIGPGGYTATVSVVLGNGDGTFSTPVDYSTGTQSNAGSIPRSIVAADFNNDGHLDLATLDSGNSEISVLLNNGNGTFSAPTFNGGWNNSGDGAFPQQLFAADLNKDGNMDLIAVASPQYGAGIAVLFGNGNGTFQQPVLYATDIQASSIAVGDFNGDGAPDVAVASGPLATVAVLMNKGDGTLIGNRNYGNNGPAPVSVAFGDFYGDGKADMVVADNASSNVIIYRNNADGTFTESANYPTGLTPTVVVVTDLNGDGKLDLVVGGSPGGGTVSISSLLGAGDGTFQPAMTDNTGLGGASVLAVADVNGDGFPDIIFNGTNTYLGANPYVLYVAFGKGDGTFLSAVATPDICMNPGFGPVISVAVADVTGDGKPDILASCQNNAGTYPANIFLLANNGSGTFASPTAIPAGTYPTAISVGDFNGDGFPDLVVGNNYPGGPNFAFLQANANGTFQSPVIYSDVDSSFWTNWSTSGTPPNGIPGPVPWPQAFAIGDFNKDGHLDILVADIAGQIGGGSNGGYYNNGVQLFLGNGDGTFQPEQSYLACWHGQAIAAADLTGGGAPSAAVACPSDGVVTVLVNQLGATVTKTATNTKLQSTSNPATLEQSVTLTATVSPSSGSGTPSGTVTFSDGSTTLGTGNLNSAGQATYSTSSLALGTHSITATYAGDTNFLGSTSTTLSQVVNKGSSSTTLQSSANPSAIGQSVTFSATVAATSGAGTPTGTVTFMDGATNLGTGSLNGSAQATLTTSALALGSHSITAVYGGDNNFTGSTSAILTQAVSKNSTSTSLQSSLNPSIVGQSVTFTATITWSTSGTPTGTVTFMDSTSSMGTGPLSGSKATFITAALTPGLHSITATYNGDGNFAGSTSGTLSQTVNKVATSTSVASSKNPSVAGQSVTFSATVTPSGTGTAGGTVTFMDGMAALGTGTLNASSQATLTTSALSSGTHSITAVFAGTSNFAGSTSTVLSQRVEDFSISATPATQTVNPGAIATYAVTLTPISGFTGSVSLSCSGAPPKGSCSVTKSVALKGTANAAATLTVKTGSSKNPSPAGSYTVTLTSTSGTLKHITTVAVIVQ